MSCDFNFKEMLLQINLKNGKQGRNGLDENSSPTLENNTRKYIWKSKKNEQMVSPDGIHPDQVVTGKSDSSKMLPELVELVASLEEDLSEDRGDELDGSDIKQNLKGSVDYFSGLEGKAILPSQATARPTDQWQTEVTEGKSRINQEKLDLMETMSADKEKNPQQKVAKTRRITLPADGFGFTWKHVFGFLIIILPSVGCSEYEIKKLPIFVKLGDVVQLTSFSCSKGDQLNYRAPDGRDISICDGMVCSKDSTYKMLKTDDNSCNLTFIATAETVGTYGNVDFHNPNMLRSTEVKFLESGQTDDPFDEKGGNVKNIAGYNDTSTSDYGGSNGSISTSTLIIITVIGAVVATVLIIVIVVICKEYQRKNMNKIIDGKRPESVPLQEIVLQPTCNQVET